MKEDNISQLGDYDAPFCEQQYTHESCYISLFIFKSFDQFDTPQTASNFRHLLSCGTIAACKVSNKSNKRLLRYCTFIFSLSCRIAFVTSYSNENEAESLQNGDVHLAQIPDFEMGYLENHLAQRGQ